jgi:two-component system nitrate/nitrite response regulator NarL
MYALSDIRTLVPGASSLPTGPLYGPLSASGTAGPTTDGAGNGMRILVCDYWVIFAEAMADLLTARGKQVIAVVHNLDDAAAVLRTTPVDVVLLDVEFGRDRPLGRLAEFRKLAPATSIVLLSGRVDAELVSAARAAGVQAIGDKRQPVAEIMRLLDRVHVGDHPALGPEPAAPRIPRQRSGPANDAQRLAAFLTRREREVLSALVCGGDTKTVARTLGITSTTARCHIQSLLTKMGAHSRLEVATMAVRSGVVNPETGDWLIDP